MICSPTNTSEALQQSTLKKKSNFELSMRYGRINGKLWILQTVL